MKFFFRVCACMLSFSPSNILQELFYKTTYKPNHDLSRIALICDEQTKLSECARWPVCQTTYYGRKQSELSKCARWPMRQTTICNAFISYFVKPFALTYALRTIAGYIVYIYCKPLNLLIFIKSHLSTLSFVIVLLLVCVSLFALHISTPNT